MIWVCLVVSVGIVVAAVGGDSGGREFPSAGSLAPSTSQACSSAVAEFEQPGLQLGCCDEAGGLVLLAKGAALSRAHFTRDHAGKQKSDKNDLHHLDRLSDAGSAPLANLASHLKPRAHSILQMHSHNGVLFFLGFVFIGVSLVIVMRYRDRQKHEIYGLPAEVDEEESGSGWRHESWVRAKHQRQHGDSPQAPSRDPQQFARGTQHHKTAEEEALERQMRGDPLSLPGSAASMAASSSAGPHRHGHGIRAQGDAFLSVAAQQEHALQEKFLREQERLNEAKERALGGVKKLGDAGFNAAQQAAEDSRKNAELAAKKLHSTTMKTIKHLDKHTGKALTVMNQKMDATAARLQMRWDEARSSNM